MSLLIDDSECFPEAKGYSVRNLKYMAKLATIFPDVVIVQEVLAQLPWYQNIALLDKIKDRDVLPLQQGVFNLEILIFCEEYIDMHKELLEIYVE